MRRKRIPSLAFAVLRDLPDRQRAALLAGPPETSVPWIAAAARYGLVEAQLLLGQILLDGRGTPRDSAMAVRWFAAAAEAGCAAAMNMLGRCLEHGWGVQPDAAAAVEWYAKAAERGLDWGLYNLADMLLHGRGISPDRSRAFTLYLRAAHLGHAKSMNMIGRYFEEGWDVVPDSRSALAWYQRAADGGDFRGQYNLGTLLLQQGRVTEAAAWLDTAVRAGSQDFLSEVCQHLERNELPAIQAIGALATARRHAPSTAKRGRDREGEFPTGRRPLPNPPPLCGGGNSVTG